MASCKCGRDMIPDLRARVTELEDKAEYYEGVVKWADRIMREARALQRNSGNFNALNLATKGYREHRSGKKDPV